MAPNALFNKSRRNIAEVIDLGARHGFRVVLYLQPHLAATKKVLTQWEEHLLAESERFYPDWNAYCRLAYPVYRAGLRALADEGAARFTDADDAISDEQQSVFVDGFHLGDRGNKLLGEHLSSLLQQGFVAGRPER